MPASAAACTALLFAYFLEQDEALHYAVSRDGLVWSPPLNGGAPVLNCSASSLRDPFIARSPAGGFRMVATNGAGFGGTPTILTWPSDDLVTWGRETVAAVMSPAFFPPHASVANTWAPEWVWDAGAGASGRYLAFWAARGDGIAPALPGPGCPGNASGRFAFFAAHSDDLIAFDPPFLLFDPGCWATGDGGIDGDLVFDAARRMWVLAYKDARGLGEGHAAEELRGIRVVTAPALLGPWTNATTSALLVPPLVEAPELVMELPAGAQPGVLLYYDCSFYPTPQGAPRPPYGVARAPSLAEPYAFTPLPGACLGNATGDAVVSFPPGATHGSFVCVTEAELQAVLAAFPEA